MNIDYATFTVLYSSGVIVTVKMSPQINTSETAYKEKDHKGGGGVFICQGGRIVSGGPIVSERSRVRSRVSNPPYLI